MTFYIVLATILVSVISFRRNDMLSRLLFNPYLVRTRNEWYRFFSSGFVHADWIHLFINMLVLYDFGQAVEIYYNDVSGYKSVLIFPALYFGGIFVSIIPTYFKYRNNPAYNALGASGAVSAVVFAYILFNPMNKICLYGLLCIPGILMGPLYLAFSIYMEKKAKDNINHGAHFWGAVFGLVFTVAVKPSVLHAFAASLSTYLR